MGYCIRVQVPKFVIKRENKKAALAAIQALAGKETITDSGGRHFSWVPYNFSNINSLRAMLAAWRYEAEDDDETGNIIGLEFTGEKYGDDKTLFSAIAPYVEAGSEIHFRGEDGECWRYKFDGKEMKDVRARLVWEDEE